MRRLTRLWGSAGRLRGGSGLRSGVLALGLALGCALGVLAFHYPEYLTTPELRRQLDVELLRRLLYWSLVAGGGIALVNLVLGRTRWLAGSALALVLVALAAGGHRVEVDPNFPDGTPYLGLDWFVLDLLGSTLVFAALERRFPLRPAQPLFRPDWQTDLAHFAVNHLAVGLFLLLVNAGVQRLFGWAVHDGLQARVRALPFWAALPLLLLVADLTQIALHRAYHRIPWLWHLHAVHHSVEHMDWLAGSRQHLLEVLITRLLVLAPVFVLGFAKPVVDAYVVIAGFQAVFIHANVRWRFGWLRHLLVTPEHHHWHHSQEAEAIDKNFAVHLAFLDHLLGTAAQTPRPWPQRYGVVGDHVPAGFWAQTLYPFRRRVTIRSSR